jgi:DNA-binding CsgD family transcriptional regulator
MACPPSGIDGFRSATPAIDRADDGNPFFVEEALQSPTPLRPVEGAGFWGGRDRASAPRAMRRPVQRPARRAGSAERRALTMAAVAGRRFDIDIVRDALHLDAATAAALMADLVAVGLVVKGTARRFAFRHALTRRVLMAGLTAGERRAARAALAAARARRGAVAAVTPLPAVSQHARPDGGRPDRGAAATAGLTKREAVVAGLLARGCTNRMIAAELAVSERTVEGHVSNILAKLEFTSRTQAAVWAAAQGMATAAPAPARIA